jgi:hypothetical protein
MPKPNRERNRINVDVGPQVQFFLNALVRHFTALGPHYHTATTSTVVRRAIMTLAKMTLTDECFIQGARIYQGTQT